MKRTKKMEKERENKRERTKINPTKEFFLCILPIFERENGKEEEK